MTWRMDETELQRGRWSWRSWEEPSCINDQRRWIPAWLPCCTPMTSGRQPGDAAGNVLRWMFYPAYPSHFTPLFHLDLKRSVSSSGTGLSHFFYGQMETAATLGLRTRRNINDWFELPWGKKKNPTNSGSIFLSVVCLSIRAVLHQPCHPSNLICLFFLLI